MVINENCPCKKKKCERHGNCDECRKHHVESKCQRPVYCPGGPYYLERKRYRGGYAFVGNGEGRK